MTTTVVIALGTNDDASASALTTVNLKAIVNSLKVRGYDTFIVVPPNSAEEVIASRNPNNPSENYKAQYDAVVAGASAAGATVLEGSYSEPEPWHLTAESANIIRNSHPNALVVGDHNAVRINGFKSTEVCKITSTSADILKRVEQNMPDPTEGSTEDANNAITITHQDKKLLDLVTKTNLAGNTYYSYYLNQKEPRLTEWTLEQVQLFQARLLKRSGKLGESSAVGKYQIIKSALKKAYTYLGLDPKQIRFTEEIQDALMIARLEEMRKLKEWKAGAFSDTDFCIQLAMEFDSIPVPRSIQPNGVRQGVPATALMKGQSFYTSPFLNTEGHNLTSLLQTLGDLRKSGPGKVYKLDITLGSKNSAAPPTGKSYKRTAEIATTGGNRVSGGRRVNTNPNEKLNLPRTGNVFSYQSIDPQDDRYDFRTGKQVRDIGINETKPVLENAEYTVGGNDPLFNAGNAPPYNPVQLDPIPPNNTMVDFETGEPVNPTIEEKKATAEKVVNELKKQGITDKKEQANILAISEYSSRLESRTTKVWSTATTVQIRQEFGAKVENLSDTEIDILKQDTVALYDDLYSDIGGNTYRDRGLIPVAGRDNYVEIGNDIDVDLVNNPDLAFDPDVSAKMTASVYKKNKESYNLNSLRNLFSFTQGVDPFSKLKSQIQSKVKLDFTSVESLSDSWLAELERTDPAQPVSDTPDVLQPLDGGLKGVSDKPLPTGKSLPSPRSATEITQSIQAEIDAINDSDYNELLAQDYLGEDANGNIIDKTNGDILGVKPLQSEIKFDSRGNVVLNKSGWRFKGNGSGAIELDV